MADNSNLLNSDSNSEHSGENSNSRSLIWNHYTKVTEEQDGKPVQFGICKYCNKKLPIKNTSNFLSHSRSKHGDKLEPQLLIVKNKTSALVNFEFSQNSYRKALVKWIVTSNQPFTVAEESDFVSMVKCLNPGAKGLSNDTIRRDILEDHKKQLQNLQLQLQEVKSCFSFTQDCWTSKSGLPFMAIKVHYLDKDWDLQEHLVDFSLLEGSHTGELLCMTFLKALTQVKIPVKRVMGITMDNAANNDTFMTELTKESKFSIISTKTQIRCLAHIVNLAVQDFLSALEILPHQEECESYSEVEEEIEVDEDQEIMVDNDDDDESMDDSDNLEVQNNVSSTIEKIRKLVRKIRKSPQLRQKLKKICEQLEVKPLMPMIDVKTRWNSTHHMLNRAKQLKVPLLNLCSSNKSLNKLIIPEKEWSILSEIDELLEHFEEASKLASSSSESTISRYLVTFDFLLETLEKLQQKRSSIVYAAAIDDAHEKISKYFPTLDDCETPYIALVLHPSLRLKYFKDQKKYTQAIQNKIKKRFLEIYQKYCEKYPEKQKQAQVDTLQNSSDTSSLFDFMNKRVKLGKEISETDEYLKSTKLPSTNVDILQWWKANEIELPILATMARDYLPIQSGSVAVEREFSGGTDLVTPTRSSLNPESVTACMMLKSYYRSNSKQ